MKIITKSFTLSILFALGLVTYCQAETALPTSSKVEKVKAEVKSSTDEDLPIKLEVKESSQNPNLKKGKGCADVKGLEEAKGATFTDYPVAETVPCETVDCKDLEPAKLYNNDFKDLPTAKTETACEE